MCFTVVVEYIALLCTTLISSHIKVAMVFPADMPLNFHFFGCVFVAEFHRLLLEFGSEWWTHMAVKAMCMSIALVPTVTYKEARK
jgi:hypothetical protein